MIETKIEPTLENVMQRVSRLEKAVLTMAWWLVQCQSGFGVQDANGIENIIEYGDSARPGGDSVVTETPEKGANTHD